MSTLSNQSYTVLAFSGVVVLYCLYKILQIGSRDKRLPPGPPTIPILGNLHQIPLQGFHTKIKEWADKYGPVYSLKLGGGTMIILNDRRAVHDLVDKKGSSYADRPIDYIASVALGGENFAFIDANPLWRSQRKIASRNLAPRMLDEKVAPIQEAEMSQLLFDLLERPEDFYNHIKRTTASIGSIIIFGNRGPTYESFWITSVFKAMEPITKVLELGVNPPVEQFPFLKYIPERWAPWIRRAKDTYKCFTAIWVENLERVEQRRRENDKRISLADTLLEGDQKMDVELSRVAMANYLGAMQQGAADTTGSSMLTTILLLATHPEVQARAQKELDEVCGSTRIPTWEDFTQLPYINCLIKEGLRFHPSLPNGIPHRAVQDDWYDGMLIPKDATIVIPAWSIGHYVYDGADEYNPDRFLDRPRLAMDYAGSPDYESRDKMNSHHWAYGAGRRICAGIHLAERTQWRMVAKMLWGFTIEPAIDPTTEKPVDLDIHSYFDGVIRYPKPFKVRFKPRSPAHAKLIRESYEGVRDYLKKWE